MHTSDGAVIGVVHQERFAARTPYGNLVFGRQTDPPQALREDQKHIDRNLT